MHSTIKKKNALSTILQSLSLLRYFTHTFDNVDANITVSPPSGFE